MQQTKIFNVGFAGCGAISTSYLNSAATFFKSFRVYSCCDALPERANGTAEKYGCKVQTWKEMIADPEVDMIINLTPHNFHAKLNMEALAAGKHVYSEKPLAGNLEEAKAILDLAKSKGLRVGCAPDTVLGAAHQCARKLLDDNTIGRPVAAVSSWIWHGPDWFPHAPMFYEENSGPTLDQGIYQLAFMVDFCGPVKSVSAMQTRGAATHRFGKDVSPVYAKEYQPFDAFPIKVMTHDTALIEFHSGIVLTYIMSNEAYATSYSGVEIYGTTGALRVENPVEFGSNPVKVCCRNDKGWKEAPNAFVYREEARGLGAADMVNAIRQNRPHRCNGEFSYHLLEVMLAIRKSAKERRIVDIESTCERMQPLAPNGCLGDVD